MRWSPQQALRHPFLTGDRFTGPFQPPPQPHMRARPAPPPPRPDGQAALSPYNSALYQSPVAAILATSPEFHAQAHAAAMAAVQVRAIDVLKYAFQCLWAALPPYWALTVHLFNFHVSTTNALAKCICADISQIWNILVMRGAL